MTPGNTYTLNADALSNCRRDYTYAHKGDKVKLISFKDHVAIVEDEIQIRFPVNIALLSETEIIKEPVKPVEKKITFKEFKQAMKPKIQLPEQNKLF